MGFFKKEEVYDPDAGRRVSCISCGLSRGCHTPKMPPTGTGKYPILHIAEAPGKNEDEQGKQLIGKSGKYYDKISKQLGFSIHDGLKTNSVICRPKNNSTPTDDQISACRKNIIKTIQDFKPKLIFLIGGVALDSYFGSRLGEKPGGINKWRGQCIPDHKYNCWVCPILHPAYVLRERNRKKVVETIFKQDIKQGLQKLEKDLPSSLDFGNISILHTQKMINLVLKKCLRKEPDLLAFDYETTGLRPNMEGHKLWCVSLCWSKDKAYVFDLKNLNEENTKLFLKILQNPRIGKTAHNMKFEERWTRFFYKTKVANWRYDTVIGSHIIDNRTGIVGLKFQLAVNFGLFNYDSEIHPFLVGRGSNGANNINTIHKADQKKLFMYCGMDSLGQYRLARKQLRTIHV